MPGRAMSTRITDMSTNADHPAIEAYAELRLQDDNAPRLDFALMQQMWLHVRSTPAQQPCDYAMALLRAMSFAFLLSQGFSEREARNQLIEAMTLFEKQYRDVVESIVKDGDDRPMVRTRPPGSERSLRRTRPATNIVQLFPKRGSKERQ